MTYGFGKVTFNEGNLDAFGRLRASHLVSQFESKNTYGVEEKSFKTTTAVNGTATHVPNEAAWALVTTTDNGSRAIRESYRYFHYYPGKSQLIQLTGVFGTAVTNCTKRIGYYDDNDGLFFIQNGTVGVGVVRRTSTSGSPVDNITYQSEWNIDKMDGTGHSGINLDFTKTQIMIIDFQWLGVGAVRFGFVVNGQSYYCHQMNHANVLNIVYMKSAWLPIRYEIVNTSATSSTSSLKQICCAVSSEGGIEPTGNLFTAMNVNVATVTSGSWTPVLSIRVENTLNSIQFRGRIQIQTYDTIAVGTNYMMFAIVENATLIGANWVSVAPTSAVSYDTSATSFTGGTYRLHIFNSKSATSSKAGSDELTGQAGTIFTVVGRGFSGNSSGHATLNWREVI